jgi:hypothetical protein
MDIVFSSKFSFLAKSKFWKNGNKGVCHVVALPFTFKSILRQKKNYGNSNISPCTTNIIFLKNSSKRSQKNPSRYYNSITNLMFWHKPKYNISKILI